MSRCITRRQALGKIGQIGALGGAAALAPRFLSGCGSEGSGPTGITTIVIVMMENRSYDHYLGGRALLGLGGDGLAPGMANPDLDGVARPIYRETVHCVADPPHGWDSSRAQWGGGACDGFVRAYQEEVGAAVAPHVMGWFGREELPVTWALADAYASCDRWFCSVMGPTWPNRMYLHTGQSNGRKNNAFPENGGFDWPTIWERLTAAGIDWAYYYSDLPFLALFPAVGTDRLWRLEDFFEDAEAGRLPAVCVVEPAFGSNDDHPPHHPMLGQMFLSSVYTALATSPQWKNCLLVITYDEHGGFFDHVPPPKAVDERAADGFDQLGFRVPTLVVGPYVKPGYVSSVVYDHTSVLRHIEKTFGLPPLTMRDAAANDLSDVLDAERLARGDWAPPIMPPPAYVDESTLDDACRQGSALKPTDLERYADAGYLPRALDLRPSLHDRLRRIGDFLARHGVGGFR